MTVSDVRPDYRKMDVTIVGPFPPPVQGVSVCNKQLADMIRKKDLSVICLNTAPVMLHGIKARKRRWLRILQALLRILRCGRRTYLVAVDGGFGIVYNILETVAIRAKRGRIALYHHSSRYVVRHSALMHALVLVAGRRAVHVMCSPNMYQQFKVLYPAGEDVIIISNAAWVDALPSTIHRRVGRIRLGYLSLVSEGKGFGRAIETLRMALSRGLQAQLTVVGRPFGVAILGMISQAQIEFGDNFQYLGYADGEIKSRFLTEIDYFLFPSLYTHETQSRVVSESMAAGVPVIAFDHRFVGELIGTGGIVVPVDSPFPERAVDWIAAIEQDPVRYAQLRQYAYDSFQLNKKASQGQIEQLVSWLVEPQARVRLAH